jgi:hypothetical protein
MKGAPSEGDNTEKPVGFFVQLSHTVSSFQPAFLSGSIPAIAQPVIPSLVAPEVCVGCRLNSAVVVVVEVPEASAYEDDFLLAR